MVRNALITAYACRELPDPKVPPELAVRKVPPALLDRTVIKVPRVPQENLETTQ